MWVKFTDQAPEDPDIEELSDGAFRLWFSAICYAQRQLTDGYVPANKLVKLVPRYRRSQLDELTRVPDDPDRDPIFTRCGDGFQIRQFEKWNKTSAYWRAERKKAADRKERWKERQTEQEENE